MMNVEARSKHQLFPAEISPVLVVAAGNLNAFVDGLIEGSGRQTKENPMLVRSSVGYQEKAKYPGVRPFR